MRSRHFRAKMHFVWWRYSSRYASLMCFECLARPSAVFFCSCGFCYSSQLSNSFAPGESECERKKTMRGHTQPAFFAPALKSQGRQKRRFKLKVFATFCLARALQIVQTHGTLRTWTLLGRRDSPNFPWQWNFFLCLSTLGDLWKAESLGCSAHSLSSQLSSLPRFPSPALNCYLCIPFISADFAQSISKFAMSIVE